MNAGVSIRPNKKIMSDLNNNISNNKERQKVSDYESSVQRQKKPHVPRTKRPKYLSKESTTTWATGAFSIKQKQAAERKMSIEIHQIKGDFKPAVDWTINRVLADYNLFVRLTFKSKEENYYISQIRQVGKRLGIKLTAAQIQEFGFKDKAFIAPIKEKLLLKVSKNSQYKFQQIWLL